MTTNLDTENGPALHARTRPDLATATATGDGEAADGGCGIGHNVLTLTTRKDHGRAGRQRGAFGSYRAPFDTR